MLRKLFAGWGLVALVAQAAFSATNVVESTQDVSILTTATNIQDTINAGDPSLFADSLDMTALFKRAIRDLPSNPKAERTFLAGFRDGADPKVVAEKYAQTCSLKLLTIQTNANEADAVYRVLNETGGLSYLTMHFARTNNAVRIDDLHNLQFGEPLGDFVRRMYLQITATSQTNLTGDQSVKDKAFVENTAQIQAFFQAVQKGDKSRALKLARKLPDSVRNSHFILGAEFGLLERGGADEARLLERWQKIYPNDPALDLLSLDSHVINSNYPAVFDSLDRLSKQYANDPYLDVLRTHHFLSCGKIEEAKASARQAIKAEPDLSNAYDALMLVALRQKDFAETSRLLTEVSEKLGQDWIPNVEKLKADEDWGPFLRSKEFRDMKKRRLKE